MIKNIFRSALLAGLTLLFFSCSFLEEKQTGSIVFDMSAVAARAATNTSFNSKDQMEIKLSGDYTAEKTFFIMDEIKEDNLIVTFDEIPVDAKIQAEATIFRVYNLSGRKDLYKGLSEPIVIVEGENQLPIQMKKISSSASDIAEYTVQHYKQNIDDDDYTLADTEAMEGKYNFTSAAEAKVYAGFTALSFENKLVNQDGSTVIKIMYDRNLHKVTYDSGVSGASISVPAEKSYRYGATIDVDFALGTRAGYDFAGWKNTASGAVYKSDGLKSFTIEDADVTLTAQWNASSDTRYTVKHLKQNVDDDNYTEVTADREEKTGISLAQTNASPKSYTGFTAQPVTQKTIAEDSSTVVEIKYNRNTYTVSYEDAVANDDISVPSDTNNYRYGATVTVDFTVGTSTGHTFKGWKDPESGKVYNSGDLTSFEIGAADVTLYAQWEANTYSIIYNMNGGAWASGYTAPSAYTYGEPLNLPDADDIVLAGYGLTGWFTSPTFNTDTKLTEIAAGTTETVEVYAQWTAGATTYKVHHLQQNVDGNGYTEVTADLQTLTGYSEHNTAAEAKSYPGFTAQAITQQLISGDGSTEITIKYDRDSHTVTYEDGVTDETISVPSAANAVYGATYNIDFTTTVSRAGYVFAGWKNITSGTTYKTGETTSFPIGTEDVTLTAQWEAATDTPYKIIHRKQKVDGLSYGEASDTGLYEVENKTGTTGEEINASSYKKLYTGFEAADIGAGTISADGSTEIEIKYDRKTYTVTYDDGVADETISVPTATTVLYQGTVNVDFSIGTRTGYTFNGWKYDGNVYKSGDVTSFEASDEDIVLTAQWEVETQNTGIDVGFGVNTSTISVSNMSTGVYTATAGYDSYTWTLDGEEVTSTSAYLDASNPNILTLTSITVPGVYDITLTATKALSGTTVTHTWTGQYIKS